jgi:hypothetical protein
MDMIKLELLISNDAARAARGELEHFLAFETSKLMGKQFDRDDTAALGYVVLRQLLHKVTTHLDRKERDDIEREQYAIRKNTPSVRSRRSVPADGAQANG